MIADGDLAVTDAKPYLASCRFSDAMEQEQGLEGWTQRYRQLRSGSYAGSVQTLKLPGMVLNRERINVAVEEETVPPADSIVFVCSMSDGSAWRVNSARQGPDRLTVARGGTEIVAAGEDNSDLLMVTVDAERLSVPPETLPPLQILPLGAEGEAVRQWLGTLLAGCERNPDSLDPDLCRLLPDLLADRLNAVLARAPEGDGTHVEPCGAFRLFQGARDLLESDPCAALTVAQLCRALEVTEKNLRDAFLLTLGIGPSVWLRQRRLDGARRDLLRAAEAGQTVSQVAMHWGFWHLGRFSAYYAALYGETPSQTARRA